MNIVIAILAGALQGLTEFLPVSSTGHLIIFQRLFNLPQDQFGLAFDASLHLGTLLAVGSFFFKDYVRALDIKNGLLLKLAIGTLPAVILGLLFESLIESTLRSLSVVGAALVLFSFVMIIAEVIGGKNSQKEVSGVKSLLIGIAQAVALIPGISRSGSTISMGLFLGLTRQEAARFAFMLSGPIIAGAGLKKFIESITSGSLSASETGTFLVGIASSFVFGFLAIKYFLKYLATKNLYPFIVYRIAVGLTLILIPIAS